jgi:hypothetical protein
MLNYTLNCTLNCTVKFSRKWHNTYGLQGGLLLMQHTACNVFCLFITALVADTVCCVSHLCACMCAVLCCGVLQMMTCV